MRCTCTSSQRKIPATPPLGGVLVWSGLDYTLVFCLLGSLLVLIGYLQRTSARLKKSTEARLTQAMAERGALREFSAEGAWPWAVCALVSRCAGAWRRRAPARCHSPPARPLLSVLSAQGLSRPSRASLQP